MNIPVEEWSDNHEMIAEMLEGQPFPYICILGSGQTEGRVFTNTVYNMSEAYRAGFLESLYDLIEALEND